MTITMDLHDVLLPAPKRGDRLRSAKNTYYVLSGRLVRRRDPAAPRRYKLRTAKIDDLEDATRYALLRSAMRRGGSFLYEFQFYPRKKKSYADFESLMRGKKS
jgi:hypothetical protein